MWGVIVGLMRLCRFIFWPRSFVGLKLRLFTIFTFGLIGNLTFDLHINFLKDIHTPSVDLSFGGADVPIVLLCALLIIFLVATNVIVDFRRRRFYGTLVDFARDPGVSEPLKRDLIEALLGDESAHF